MKLNGDIYRIKYREKMTENKTMKRLYEVKKQGSTDLPAKRSRDETRK